ncbi:MAG: lamin tail domain-containing protein [Candidatus Hinthialibacter antarcticus]|nr:lamin tail domain-containing protein [Candidatus Hinthialibacter antarcticus]
MYFSSLKRVFISTFLLIAAVSVYGDVIINEIMYNPRSNGNDAEYVELYNRSDSAVDLSGWQFSDGISFTFPLGTQIAAKRYIVVCRNELFVRDFYRLDPAMATLGNYAPSGLSNSGETLTLRDINGLLIDRVEYNDAAPWPTPADGNGSSLELMHPQTDNSNATYWAPSIRPTPGQANSQLLSSIPPRFVSIQRTPQIPGSDSPISVVVQFEEGDVLQEATLSYIVNNGSQQNVPMQANGNVFNGEIPAQADGAFVEYWVTVISEQGFGLTLPVGTVENRYVYRVMQALPEPGSVVINEVMYNNPVAFEDDREFIELFNPGAATIDLSFWKLRDSNDDNFYTLPVGTSIAANGFLVISKRKEAGWPDPVLENLSFSFGDNGDEVRLFDPNDRLIAKVEYNDSAEWPVGADGEGGSLELLQASRPNNDPNNWAVSANGGSPGRANVRAVNDSAYADYDIVINEIFYHPPNEEYDNNIRLEYIELYNRGDKPVDVRGWRFTRGVEFSIAETTVIQPKGYLLIDKNPGDYANITNRRGGFALTLDNGGEAIALTSDDGVVIDYVEYADSFPWPTLPDGEGRSLELIAPFGDNRDAQYWANGRPNSPGKANHAILTNAPPRITDVQHTPERPVASTVDSDVVFTTVVETGDLWRIFKGTEQPPNNWNARSFNASSWEEGPSGIGYGDGDDATELSDMRDNYQSVYIRTEFTIQNLNRVDSILFSIDYDDSYVAYLNGQEISRSNVSGNPPSYTTFANANHGASVDDGAGAIDQVDITSFLPLLVEGTNVLAIQGHNVNLGSSDFSLIPQLAVGRAFTQGEEISDSIVIEAQVRDSDGVDSVTLQYQRLASPAGVGLFVEDWKSTPMFDDGAHGDRFANDGRYAVIFTDIETIQPNEAWRYRIAAKDASGVEALRPLQDDSMRNYILFVNDALEEVAYPTIKLYAEQSTLAFLTRNPDTNQEQPCIAVIDGKPFDLFYGGGVRFRGDGLRNNPKKNWKIVFPKGERYKGQRALNLNANNHTTALLDGESGVLEHLAYQVFEDLGVTAPDTKHVRIMLNNEYIGLYLQVEQVNEDFLSEHNLADETDIYKAGVGSRRANMAREPDFDTYVLKYESMLRRDSDIQTLVDFIEGLNDAENLPAFFAQNLDVESYVNYLCAIALTTHFDSVEKNYLPTRGADGRWKIVPIDAVNTWGLTLTNMAFPLASDFDVLDGADSGRFFGTNVLRKKFLSVPEYRAMYFERLRSLVETYFTNDNLNTLIDAYWTFIQSGMQENKDRWGSAVSLSSIPSQLKTYIAERRAFIMADTDVFPTGRSVKPVNNAPANNASLNNRTVTLRVNQPSGQTIVETEWQIDFASGLFVKPVWSIKVLPTSNANSYLLPAGVLASGGQYKWRMRWKVKTGADGEVQAWSDWSDATQFTMQSSLAPPDVQNVVVTNFDSSARFEWDPMPASDLLRVDIFDLDGEIIESTSADDNRVRITGLLNGQTHRFLVRVVSTDLQVSPGVLVEAKPSGPPADGQVIAYFRFEGNAQDQSGNFTNGMLMGDAQFASPGSRNPVPQTNEQNQQALNLGGRTGAGFQFGSTEALLDVAKTLTVECYAKFDEPTGQMVLVDRYDDANASQDGVWRFAAGMNGDRSLDFILNDEDRSSGYFGRLHISAPATIWSDGEFHHYAAVVNLDSSSFQDRVRLYRNGRQVPSQIIHDDGESQYNRFRNQSDLPILIGARRVAGVGTVDVLKGSIDEVRLTAAALEPQAFLNPPDPSVDEWALY